MVNRFRFTALQKSEAHGVIYPNIRGLLFKFRSLLHVNLCYAKYFRATKLTALLEYLDLLCEEKFLVYTKVNYDIWG